MPLSCFLSQGALCCFRATVRLVRGYKKIVALSPSRPAPHPRLDKNTRLDSGRMDAPLPQAGTPGVLPSLLHSQSLRGSPGSSDPALRPTRSAAFPEGDGSDSLRVL